jgi:hypothetical protein
VQNNPLALSDPAGLDCVYLNNSGAGVYWIDHESTSGECGENGGYWLEGYVDASNVTVDADGGLVSGYGTGTNGNI